MLAQTGPDLLPSTAPLLSLDEERALATTYAEGRHAAAQLADGGGSGPAAVVVLRRAIEQGDAARACLILAHVRLVTSIARHYRGRGVAEADLVQEGIVGLITAVDRFDASHGVRLSSYAVAFVRRHVADEVSSRRTVRLPPKAERDAVACREAADTLQRATGRHPSAAEIAQRVGLTVTLVERLRAADASPLSLAAAAAHVDVDAQSPPRDFCSGDCTTTTVRDAVATLPSDERDVVERRFGLDGAGSRAAHVVADELGRTTAWVRRTERRALRWLRSHPAVLGLQADGR
ncbi:sigma-70 family RNA polymerase sigma factor [Mumia sp. Pv 4-285]|uniref:sigma-70 family RNA polymerase sigma factor n=1 Tax=Mumia qirimensis TaxID=3234852 RepID=UPI00351D7430